MPAPASTAELTDVILKSGVVDEARLRGYLAKLTDPPADPPQLAGLMVRDGILTYFQAEQLLQGKWKRFFIGKYKVLERLGVGGMGQVFLCEHKLMKRRVAVKVLPAAKAQDPASLQRFYREARAVAAVDHPNLVRAYDIDEDGGLHFLVMEFVDGANLHDMVKKFGPMDVLRACHYMYGSAVGLHHAAEMGLIHRDIKPANILVDRTGVVKILDMGLARFFNPEEDDMLTKKFDENVLGTADYLAPEQAIDSTAVDVRADIYGLGGTFYYLLTGSPPFLEGTVAQKLLWHQTKEPRPVRDIRPDVPPEVAAIVAKMMAKNPADRFQSPAELMAALAPWVQTPIGPPPFAEMPLFSTAAVGNRPSPGSGAPLSVASAATQMAVKQPAKPTSAPPMYTPPMYAQSPATATVTSAPLAAPAPLPSGWESFTADTLPNAQADTRRRKADEDADDALDDDRSARRKKAGKSVARSAPGRKKKPAGGGSALLFILGGLALVGGGAAALLAWKPWAGGDTVTPDTPPVVDSRKWYVTAGANSPDPKRTAKTLAEAVRSVRSGETVVILDDRIDGPAVIVPSSVKNVRIEAGNAAKSVTWVFTPDKSRVNAVLDIRAYEGVTVEGLVIDVNKLHDTGVLLNYGEGTSLLRVTVKNAKAAAFQLNNIDAKEKALRLTGCRATASPVGVLLSATGKLASKNVAVQDCRFDGCETALRIEGPAEGLEFKNNRVFKAARGVQWVSAVPATDKVSVAVERNTFHTVTEAGIKFEAAVAGPRQEFTVRRNFFAGTATLAGGQGGFKAVENSRDAASKDGGGLTAAEVKDFSFPAAATNPNEDATFLRDPRLSAAGVGAE